MSRRGSVTGNVTYATTTCPGKPDASRLTTVDVVRRAVRTVRRNHPSLPIVIFSEGDAKELSEFECDGVTLKLDGDVLEMWTEMATSEVLVTARSSLSKTAAIFCRGTVYDTPGTIWNVDDRMLRWRSY